MRIAISRLSRKHIRRIPLRYTVILCVLFLLVQGCSSMNCTRLENILGSKTNLVEFSYMIAQNLENRAYPPLLPRHPDQPILITTFVDNNDLQKTNAFGRLLQEHINSAFSKLGYTVREIKLADTVTISPQHGETMLTRDIARLDQDLQAQAVMVGTISRTNRTLYISARLINPHNRNIISSDDYQLCMDDDILAMFKLGRQDDIDTPIKDPRGGFWDNLMN